MNSSSVNCRRCAASTWSFWRLSTSISFICFRKPTSSSEHRFFSRLFSAITFWSSARASWPAPSCLRRRSRSWARWRSSSSSARLSRTSFARCSPDAPLASFFASAAARARAELALEHLGARFVALRRFLRDLELGAQRLLALLEARALGLPLLGALDRLVRRRRAVRQLRARLLELLLEDDQPRLLVAQRRLRAQLRLRHRRAAARAPEELLRRGRRHVLAVRRRRRARRPARRLFRRRRGAAVAPATTAASPPRRPRRRRRLVVPLRDARSDAPTLDGSRASFSSCSFTAELAAATAFSLTRSSCSLSLLPRLRRRGGSEKIARPGRSVVGGSNERAERTAAPPHAR